MKFYDIIDDRYFEEMVVEMAHHSTSIEGNTLTLNETRNILQYNLIDVKRPISKREIYEVDNYKNIINFLLSDYPFNIETIKLFHKILTNNTVYDAGCFKKEENRIGHQLTTHPRQVLEAMVNWVDNTSYRLNIAKNDNEKLKIIVETHIEFERIHPFSDGNGRTGRLLMIYLALREKIIPFIIQKNDRNEYIDFLENNQIDEFMKYLKDLQLIEIKRVEEMYNITLDKEETKNIKDYQKE